MNTRENLLVVEELDINRHLPGLYFGMGGPGTSPTRGNPRSLEATRETLNGLSDTSHGSPSRRGCPARPKIPASLTDCASSETEISLRNAAWLEMERLAGIVNSVNPVMIYWLKLVRKGVIHLWISENVLQLTGFDIEEARAPQWWENHVHPDDLERLGGALTASSPNGPIREEYRFRHKNGEYRWIQDERKLLRNENEIAKEIVGSWIDITNRKTLEEQLRQAQKMESIGHLAGGVAHDFNNLLTIIGTNAELLLTEQEGLSGQSKEMISSIGKAVDKAAALNRQLLSFSRRNSMDMQVVDLNAVIATFTEMLRRIVGERIELRTHFAANLPFIRADTVTVEQVLMNLIVNARDAMPKGGRLSISTHLESIDEMQTRLNPKSRCGDFVCLAVQDTGQGIASENLLHLFEPFFTTKPADKGTGLGLATAFAIVEQHEGWINVASELGKGTNFSVFFPITREIIAPEIVKPTVKARGGSETILVVEDEEMLRDLVGKILEKLGYKVFKADTGTSAWNLWTEQAQKIDLLLTDMVMPGTMSGLDLAVELRKEKPDLKVALMSGYSSQLAGIDMSALSEIRFLQKPFSAQVLMQMIRQCLDERRA